MPVAILYYYRLSNVNSDWQFAGNHGMAVFNSPGAGYLSTFILKLLHPDGVMSPEKVSL